MTRPLVDAVRRVRPDLTAEEIAETLWLARFVNSGRPAGPGPAARSALPGSGVPPPPAPAPPLPGGLEVPAGVAHSAVPGRAAGLYLPDTAPAGGIATRSPKARALPGTLAIERALRPLRLEVSGPDPARLDEERTATATADAGGVLAVHTAPAREPLLDLALVVDRSPSMVVWQQTINELLAVLARLRAFRDITVWSLETGVEHGLPLLYRGGSVGRRGRPRDPRELVDPRRRRLVLMVTDFVGPSWAARTVQRVLRLWAGYGPIAVLQLLPYRLWSRGNAPLTRVALDSPGPAAPNTELAVTPVDRTADLESRGVPIPVLEIDARWLGPWARLVAATTGHRFRGVALFTDDPPGDEPTPAGPAKGAPSTPDEAVARVERFRLRATPEAARLATYLAAAPLNLPIMRLVQQVMLHDSRPRYLAEVFLGDLLCRVEPHDPTVAPDEVRYDFLPGVREVLLGGLLARERLQILNGVSAFVRQRFGSTADFAAVLAGAPVDEMVAGPARFFAVVMETVLRGMGGRYRQLAEELAAAIARADTERGGIDSSQSASDEAGATRPAPAGGGRISLTPTDGVIVTEPAPVAIDQTSTDAQPAVWERVPPRNPNFTGREELLQRLRESLTQQATALLPHALHGLGGVGKTQLAIEYVYRFRGEYDLVWWVEAEQSAVLRESLSNLAARLGITPSDDISQTIEAVHDALRTGRQFRRWLLVFDNADRADGEDDRPDDIAQFLSNPGGHVLITSRRRHWSDVATTLEVDVFDRAESVQLLQRRLPGITNADAELLAEALGDLPLALEQAAAFQSATATPVSEYLDLLDKRIGQLLRLGPPSTYPTSVAAAWGLAFDELARISSAAAQLLELCAFFGPEPISIALLKYGRQARLPAELEEAISDEIEIRRAIAAIDRYGLARVEPARDRLQVHRLVQGVLRDRLGPEQRAARRQQVHEVLAAANPVEDPENHREEWPRHAQLSPHVVPTGVIEGNTRSIRDVVLKQIRYLYARGDYESSRDLASRAYEYWRKELGADHEQTIVTGRFLGNALRALGRIADARTINQEVLHRSLRVLGEEHGHTLAIATSVGADLRLLGEWEEARTRDEETRARYLRVLGEDDPHTLRVSNNLAIDLRLLGRFEEARQLDQDNLRRREAVLGDDQAYTLSMRNMVARDLYGLGDFQTALALQQASLPRYQEVLGSDHPNVLRVLRNHAVTLRQVGQYQEAYELSRSVAERLRKIFGDRHHETFIAMMTLSNDLLKIGQAAEARVVGEDALARHRTFFGETHPLTRVCMMNLATVLRATAEYGTARGLDEQALAGLHAALGPDHPYSMCCAANLTHDLVLAREHEAALALSADTYERFVRVNGEEHPETIGAANNYALDLQTSGDTTRGLELATTAVRRYHHVLGASHPETIAATAGRRIAFAVEPPPL